MSRARVSAESLPAFTNIELVIALAIAGVAAALTAIFIHKGDALDEARSEIALGLVRETAFAVNAYWTDYERLPPLNDAESVSEPGKDALLGEAVIGASAPNNALMVTLLSIPKGPNRDHAANPRKVTYWDYRLSALSRRRALAIPGNHGAGFYFDTEFRGTPPPHLEYCLFDPWGRQIGIILDTDGDGRIEVSGVYHDLAHKPSAEANLLHSKAEAFSLGKDGTVGTKGDHRYRGRFFGTSDDRVSWDARK